MGGGLVLNLPSLWRLVRPYTTATHEMIDFLAALAHTRFDRLRNDPRLDQLHLLALEASVSLLPKRKQTRYCEEWRAELVAMPRRVRTYFCASLLAGSPRLAIAARLARPRS